jgi:hypothetical protein
MESFLEISAYSDVEQLLRTGMPEDLHLEYKSGYPHPAERNKFNTDIAQDVSAFANSDGGTLLIGIIEKENRPTEINGVGISRESIGQTIASRVSPTIVGLRIKEICCPDQKSVLAVTVPKSNDAPHQGPNNLYYRRHEHHNQPLAHHEIEDLRRRQIVLTPLVTLSTAARGAIQSAIDVRNPGQYSAENIRFSFSSVIKWPRDKPPSAFVNGIRHLAPGQHLRFRFTSFAKLLSDPKVPAIFDISVEYTHSRLRQRIGHVWTLDFEAYRESMSILTEEQEDRKAILDELEHIRKSLEKLSGVADYMQTLVGTNGLDLSIYTLRNLQRVAQRRQPEKMQAKWMNAREFQSALGVDLGLAIQLERLFDDRVATRQELSVVQGMTPDILARFEETFGIDAGESSILMTSAEKREDRS